MELVDNLTREEIDQRIAKTTVEAVIEIGYYLKQIRRAGLSLPMNPVICIWWEVRSRRKKQVGTLENGQSMRVTINTQAMRQSLWSF